MRTWHRHIINNSNNTVNLIYEVDLGKKAKIKKIKFIGDKKYKNRKLYRIIASEENKFWKFISDRKLLNQDRINLDKKLLEGYYKNKGYYEVDISSSNVEYSEGEGFILTFSINAGKRYKFKKIFADVSDALEKSAFNSLEPEFNKLIGQYYSQSKLTSLIVIF